MKEIVIIMYAAMNTLVIICVMIKIYKDHPEKWFQTTMKDVFSCVKQNVRKIVNAYT